MNRAFCDFSVIARRFVSGAGLHASITDADLLRQFIAGHDEVAFESIVLRHGPMVLDVCRAALNGWADAEDAFQATFLVLARRANTIRDQDALARWLFGVATRTACKARTAAARQRKHEAAGPAPDPAQPIDPAWSEVQTIIREELARMAERHRQPLELCYLQGRTQDEAAALLDLSKGTLRRRLERAREVLRERLVRRGLGPAAMFVLAAWPLSIVAATVPNGLARTTAALASRFATGDSSAVAATVSSLTHGVMSAISFSKLKIAAVTTALLLAALTAGAWGFSAKAGVGPVSGDHLVPASLGAREVAEPEEPKNKPLEKQEKALMTVTLDKIGTGRCAFLDNDLVLVSPGTSNGLDVRDMKTGKVLKTLSVEGNFLGAFRLSADRRWVAAVTTPKPTGTFLVPRVEQDITVWDTATWTARGTIGSRGLLALAGDGKTVLVSHTGRVEVWDVVANKKLKSAPFEFKEIDVAAISPDSALVVVSGSNEIAYWRWQDGDKYDRIKVGRKVDALVFSPDGKFVSEGPASGVKVAVRDVATLQVARELSDPTQPRVTQMAAGMVFADGGMTVVLGNRVSLIESIPVPRRIHVWDVKSGKMKRQFPVEAGTSCSLDVSPDGKTLAAVIENQDGLALAKWSLINK